jgi:DNA segregation ATPase FtsK/SpoIIIE, S-DNA-T family
MRSLLDHQADGIEYTLHSHGIEGNVVGGNISPRLIQFHIKLGAGVRYNRVVALADELALALGVRHCRITREGHHVKIEVPRPDPVAVRLFPLMRNLPGDLPPNSPILGLDENGVPLLIRVDAPDIGHILVSGASGSGKTTLARSMISSMALQNPPEYLKMLLIDIRGRAYREFNGLPNMVSDVVTDPVDAVHRMRWVLRHLEKRAEKCVNTPILVIFIDELADLVQHGGKEIEQIVRQLTEYGLDYGIHLVACTRKASSAALGAIARSNFPARIVGLTHSPEDARWGSGTNGSGADKLTGRGDFLLFARGEVTRVQAAHVNQDEMLQTVDYLTGAVQVAEPSRALPAATSQSRQIEARHQPRAVAKLHDYYAEDDGYATSREFQRTQPDAAYDDPYGEETGDNYEYDETVSNSNRHFGAAASNRYSNLPPEQMGIAERMAEYETNIRGRRRPPLVEYQYTEPEAYVEEEQETPLQQVAEPPKPAVRPVASTSRFDPNFDEVAPPRRPFQPRQPEPEPVREREEVKRPESVRQAQPAAPKSAPAYDNEQEEKVAPPRPVVQSRPTSTPNPVARPSQPAPQTRPAAPQPQARPAASSNSNSPVSPPRPASNVNAPQNRPVTSNPAPAPANNRPVAPQSQPQPQTRPAPQAQPPRPAQPQSSPQARPAVPAQRPFVAPQRPPVPAVAPRVPRPVEKPGNSNRQEMPVRQQAPTRDLWDDFLPDPEPDYSSDIDYDEARDSDADEQEQEREPELNNRITQMQSNLRMFNGRTMLNSMKPRNPNDYKISS